MKKASCFWSFLSLFVFLGSFSLSGFVVTSYAAPPVVSGITASQRAGTQLVDIYYNVSDADGNSPVTIYVAISDNAGASYNVPVFTLTGAVGPGVVPGNSLHITWNAGTDWPGRFNNQCKVKIIADDGTAPPAPANMAYIPAGAIQMGDNLDGNTSAMPVHTVYISAFFMDKYEVRKELWQTVYAWAAGNSYSFNNGETFSGSGHPVQTISWYDAAKWCNARSEMEGLTPCYYTSSSLSTVFRSGTPNITNACVNWNANGYRLPTEAEWEKAARGGSNGNRYPWGNSVSTNDANYSSPGTGTKPGGSYAANGYGLYDMGGNVWEWCWDWYDGSWYGKPGANVDNSRGPDAVQSSRLLRGGAWKDDSSYLRCAGRVSVAPGNAESDIGFRCVRGLTL